MPEIDTAHEAVPASEQAEKRTEQTHSLMIGNAIGGRSSRSGRVSATAYHTQESQLLRITLKCDLIVRLPGSPGADLLSSCSSVSGGHCSQPSDYGYIVGVI